MRTLVIALRIHDMPRQESPDAVLCRNLEEVLSDPVCGPDKLLDLLSHQFSVACRFEEVKHDPASDYTQVG